MPDSSLPVTSLAPSPCYAAGMPGASVSMLRLAGREGLWVLPPVEVVKDEVSPPYAKRYRIVGGARTYRAACALKKEAVHVVVLAGLTADEERVKVSRELQETLAKDNPLDIAEYMNSYREEHKYKLPEACFMLGWDYTKTRQVMRVLKLIPALQQALAEGRLTLGKAKALAGRSPSEQQALMSGNMLSLTTRAVEEAMPRKRRRRRKVTPVQKTAHQEVVTDQAAMRPVVNKLKEKVGSVVELEGTASKGEVRIRYGESEEILEGVIERLNAKSLPDLAKKTGMRVAVEFAGKAGTLLLSYADAKSFDRLFSLAGLTF